MNYTKGEWKVVHEMNVESETRRGICSCGFQSNHNPVATFQENVANAHLIAAAPKMYEALKDLYEVVNNLDIDIVDDNQADALAVALTHALATILAVEVK